MSEADRVEGLVKRRIERKSYDSALRAGLAGRRFLPLQLPGESDSVGRDYRRNHWSVSELLAYYDKQFVQNAYLVLLKRDADVEGMTQRLQSTVIAVYWCHRRRGRWNQPASKTAHHQTP